MPPQRWTKKVVVVVYRISQRKEGKRSKYEGTREREKGEEEGHNNMRLLCVAIAIASVAVFLPTIAGKSLFLALLHIILVFVNVQS